MNDNHANPRRRAVFLAKQMFAIAMQQARYVQPNGIIAPVGDYYECTVTTTGHVVWLTVDGRYAKSMPMEHANCQ